MKNKKTKILILLILALMLVCASSCSKAEERVAEEDTAPVVQESSVAAVAKEKVAEPSGAAVAKEKVAEPSGAAVVEKKVAEPSRAAAVNDKPAVYRCTFSIECGTILDNIEALTEGKETLVPSDGIVLAATEIEFNEGESVFDILNKATKDNKIHMEFVNTPVYKSAYIEGINNLYEFDCGPLSGWMYTVNGLFPNYGSSKHILKDGDVIKWIYSCDLGRDIGGEGISQ